MGPSGYLGDELDDLTDDLDKQKKKVSWLGTAWNEFLDYATQNSSQLFESVLSGLRSFGTELQKSNNALASILGTFISGIQLIQHEIIDEYGRGTGQYITDWEATFKQMVMNVVKAGIETFISSIATLFGESAYAELGKYGSRGEVRYPNFDEMVKNFRNWDKNFAEIQRLEKQKARNTVGGGIGGGVLGFLLGGPIGAFVGAGIGAAAGNQASKNITKQMDELREKLADTFEKISNFLGTSIADVASALGNAFSAQTYTGFVKSFSASLEEMTRNALLQAFLASEYMQPLLDNLSQAITEAVIDGTVGEDDRERIRAAAEAVNKASAEYYKTIRGFSLFNDGEGVDNSRGRAGTVLQNLTGPALNEFKEMLSPLGRFGEALALLGSINSHVATIAGNTSGGGGTTFYIDRVEVTVQDYQDMDKFLYDLEMSARSKSRGRGR